MLVVPVVGLKQNFNSIQRCYCSLGAHPSNSWKQINIFHQLFKYIKCYYEIKVFPLQARCGPEGGYRCSSTLP